MILDNQKNSQEISIQEFHEIMLWKLGLGNMGDFFSGKNPLPDKDIIATEQSWKIEPMPDKDVSEIPTRIAISEENMQIIRRGHIPRGMEDHWFMYCDSEYIRYYRSWTGMCAYEAHYIKDNEGWLIDRLVVNQGLAEWGVNGDVPGLYLFIYLITAEIGADASDQWQNYLDKWEENNFRYDSKNEEEEVNLKTQYLREKENLKLDKQDGTYERKLINEEEEVNLKTQYLREKENLKLDKQDGTYERKLIQDFIDQKLDGDIDRLVDWKWSAIQEDEIWGNSQFFTKSNIVKAIMSVTFGDLWPGMTQDSLDNYAYNVTQIHQMHYLFGSNISDEYFMGMQNFSPSQKQIQRAVKVSHLLETIGNLWVFPGYIDAEKDTYHYHGYADLYLKDLYSVMTGKGKGRADLQGRVYNARKAMQHLQGADGFDKMAKALFLDDFLDYYGKPTDVLPQIWFSMKSLKSKDYFKAVDDYCSFMEQFVPKRAKLIVEKLRVALSKENISKKRYIQGLLDEERNNRFAKAGYEFLKALNHVEKETTEQKPSHLLAILDSLRLRKGLALGLQIAQEQGMGDESLLYVYPKENEGEPLEANFPIMQNPYPEEGEEDLFFKQFSVQRTAMGIWQAYLLSIVPTQLPTFWHGGYIARTYIFTHKELAQIEELGHTKAPLYGIREAVSPQVKIRGNNGTIQCCYWNDWKGLVRETIRVTYANDTIYSFESIQEDILYPYHCGILF